MPSRVQKMVTATPAQMIGVGRIPGAGLSIFQGPLGITAPLLLGYAGLTLLDSLDMYFVFPLTIMWALSAT